jgi:hypothetical protein
VACRVILLRIISALINCTNFRMNGDPAAVSIKIRPIARPYVKGLLAG